ncbi:MAG: glycosyltransferase family 2 protein [Sphingobacteriaceae bacterium]|nr:glycosyltransferase family 2 protein [Sphingobacteriaceae bacterium]
MEQPLVSICIPVYNGEQFIDETVQCCLAQTHKNIEILFSDNCSTDKTVELIRKYNDPRIKIYSNETNIGLLANFKKCFTYATGKYMSFLGADDGMEPTCIEKAVNILEAPENKDVVLVNTFIQIIDEQSKTVFTKNLFWWRKDLRKWGIRSDFYMVQIPLANQTDRCGEKKPTIKFRNQNSETEIHGQPILT